MPNSICDLLQRMFGCLPPSTGGGGSEGVGASPDVKRPPVDRRNLTARVYVTRVSFRLKRRVRVEEYRRTTLGKLLNAEGRLPPEFASLPAVPMFTAKSPQELATIFERSQGRAPDYLRHFDALLPPARRGEAAKLAKLLQQEAAVEYVWVERPAPLPGELTDGYILPAQAAAAGPPPVPGMDVLRARAAGLTGKGVRMVVLERRWPTGHEDVPQVKTIRPTPDIPPPPNETSQQKADREAREAVLYAEERAHGVAVLGLIGAPDNGVGLIGVAPGVELYTASTVRSDGGICVADAVTAALAATDPADASQPLLRRGDVLLIEEQVDTGGGRFDAGEEGGAMVLAPCEWNLPAFQEIRRATAADRGIVVVEAAGNYFGYAGSAAADLADRTLGSAAMRAGMDASIAADRLSAAPGSPSDSGALIATAADAAARAVLDDVNLGPRANCASWGIAPGGALVSCGNPPPAGFYSRRLSRTSAASALIAGVCALVQEQARVRHGTPLDGRALRTVLADPTIGTAIAYTRGGSGVVAMPDLARLLDDPRVVETPVD